jgi:phosphoribosyl 1,2-cyclic phosphodiesterase
MRLGSRLLIFDSGTGMRPLGLQMDNGEKLDFDLFFSHTHWDHIAGLPFFCPAYRAENCIRIHAGHLAPEGRIEDVLRQSMSPPLFPVPLDVLRSKKSFHDFRAGDTLDIGDGIRLRTALLNHPDRATGYRVEYGGKAVCYVTDTEHVPGTLDRNILDLIAGSDLVIYDSTYQDDEFEKYVGWGHSTWQEGIRLCKAADVHRLAIFHHDPGRSDDALDRIGEAARAQLDGAFIATEGEVVRP